MQSMGSNFQILALRFFIRRCSIVLLRFLNFYKGLWRGEIFACDESKGLLT